MILIIDTNIIIEFARVPVHSQNQSIWTTLIRFSKVYGHQLVIPSVALFEFFAGSEMNSKVNRQKAANILSDVTVVDITQEIAETAASLYRIHKATIGVIDYILAATAISLDAELVTLNKKHFQLLEEVRLFDLSQF